MTIYTTFGDKLDSGLTGRNIICIAPATLFQWVPDPSCYHPGPDILFWYCFHSLQLFYACSQLVTSSLPLLEKKEDKEKTFLQEIRESKQTSRIDGRAIVHIQEGYFHKGERRECVWKS